MPVKRMEIRDKIVLGRPIMMASDGRITPSSTTACTIANNFNNFNNINTIASQPIPKIITPSDLQALVGPRTEVRIVSFQEIPNNSYEQLVKEVAEVKADVKKALSEISQIKNLICQLLNQPQHPNVESPEPPIVVPIRASFPIDNITEMSAIENKLAENEDFFQNMVNEFTNYLEHETENRNARSCSYAIVDQFFTRDFLLNFTWTGSTRNEGAKFAMRTFQNIIKLFYTVINNAADSACDMAEIEDFFKSILKNSQKRVSSLNGERNRCTSNKKPKNQNIVTSDSSYSKIDDCEVVCINDDGSDSNT
ncbi:uncharacterized protein LOC129807438 isoform X2 [Phlebotomus papatasi]|uniref:uncharacterized protein LOC129807438 isoform X2 n=2 Tax=Phlebotomus papatasi TaxID=29031 RepID=UPI0024842626|nr:uncharacterized protein LOC129807438 isoform X2 [Phlebotomus papatasi]